MKKETMDFAERQQEVTICNGGRQALVLLNERPETREVWMPEEGTEEQTVFVYDGYWLNVDGGQDVLSAARKAVAEEIDKYDTSSAVNGFVLNGQRVWLDKSTRVGLMNSTTIAKAAGNKTTTLWLGDNRLEVDCDKAIQLLSALEMYALQCFNVTAAHKAEVNGITDIDKVLAYDVTAGYPEQLKMEV